MNRISKLRKLHGITQMQLSKILGVAQNTVSNWEKQIQYIDAQDFVDFDTQATPEGVPVDDAWCAVCTLICDGCFALVSAEEV